MKKDKFKIKWWMWVTELIGLLILVGINVLFVFGNISVFTNQSVSIVQKATNIIGIISLEYGCFLIVWDLVKVTRRYILKIEKQLEQNRNYMFSDRLDDVERRFIAATRIAGHKNANEIKDKLKEIKDLWLDT